MPRAWVLTMVPVLLFASGLASWGVSALAGWPQSTGGRIL